MKEHSLGADRLVCFMCVCEVSTKMIVEKADKDMAEFRADNEKLRGNFQRSVNDLKIVADERNDLWELLNLYAPYVAHEWESKRTATNRTGRQP
jgi:hypothetical protein